MSKIPSVSDIETDPGALVCSFKISDPDVDYEAELAKYAETNSHLADYTIE
ncbi:MAG: hypothetical protein Aurels2KO_01530 [Aureliella sp.]